MQRCQNLVENTFWPPLFVVPEDGGVGGQVFRQVTPVTAVFELIENAVKDLPFAPFEGACFLLLGQQRFDEFPLFVA